MINKQQHIEALSLARAIIEPCHKEGNATFIYADCVLQALIEQADDVFKGDKGRASVPSDNIIIKHG